MRHKLACDSEKTLKNEPFSEVTDDAWRVSFSFMDEGYEGAFEDPDTKPPRVFSPLEALSPLCAAPSFQSPRKTEPHLKEVRLCPDSLR